MSESTSADLQGLALPAAPSPSATGESDWLISRRRMLVVGAFGFATSSVPLLHADDNPPGVVKSRMGLVIYDCNHRRKWLRDQNAGRELFEPITFLKHCRSVGAGGMQANLGTLTTKAVRQLREFAEQHDLFIDAIIKPPNDNTDRSRFEAEIETARDVGVQAVRTTILPGRRYERFKTLEAFREFEKRGTEMLRRAVPIVEKHKVPFAVENHKDQRLDERISLLKQIDSEFVGVCLDTGNSLALLDGAYEPIEALSPYAFTVHLKDQAVQRYRDGFLLGDVPLGQGSLDLKRIVSTIRAAKPDIRFSLELITRDPLKVPCLTDGFWATLPNVPASDLARTLRFVRDHTADGQLVEGHSLADQVKLEDSNIRSSLQFARQELAL